LALLRAHFLWMLQFLGLALILILPLMHLSGSSLVMLLSKLYSALMITRLLGRMDTPPSSSKNPRILLVVISVMQSVTSLSMKTSQAD
jgi:membrane protein implicated in regulation of membrane protease activity